MTGKSFNKAKVLVQMSSMSRVAKISLALLLFKAISKYLILKPNHEAEVYSNLVESDLIKYLQLS